MRKILFLSLLLLCCNNCSVRESSSQSLSKLPDETNNAKRESKTDRKHDVPDPAWELRETVNANIVSFSLPEMPQIPVQTVFEFHCRKTDDAVTYFNYIIKNADRISDFGFKDFEGPDAPAQTRKLVSLEAQFDYLLTGNNVKATWRFFVTGGYGCNNEPDSFCLSDSAKNEPDPTAQIAQFIAQGGYTLAINVSDYKNPKTTLRSVLPPVDPKSEIAKTLRDCRF